MPHTPFHRPALPWTPTWRPPVPNQFADRSYRQGLMDRLSGGNQRQGLLGQNQLFRQPTRGRNTLISTPSPATQNATGSMFARIGAPGRPDPTQNVVQVDRRNVSDILSRLRQSGPQPGGAAPLPHPLDAGLEPTIRGGSVMPMRVPELGGPRLDLDPQLMQAPEGIAPEGPQGLIGKIGGFFKRPGVSEALLGAGAAMMSGRDAQGRPYTDPFQSIGAGLQAGMGVYGKAKTARQLEEDRARDLADRERTLAAVETLKEGLTEDQQATIDAYIATGDYGKAGELAQGYEREAKLDEAFMKAGGQYITDPYEYEFVKNMVPDKRNTWMVEFFESERGRVARATAIQQLYPGLSDADAKNIAHDAAATDRMMSRPSEAQIFTDAEGVGWLLDKSLNAQGDRVLGKFGPVKIDLDAQRFAAQKEATRLSRIEPQFKDIVEEYQRFVPTFNALKDYERALAILNDPNTPDPYTGPMSNIQQNIGKWFQGDRTKSTQEIDNVLLGLGMENLAYFRGAISEKEMEQALKKAGTTGDLKGALQAVLESAVRRQTAEMETHNARVEEYLGKHNVVDWKYWQLDPDRLVAMQAQTPLTPSPSPADPDILPVYIDRETGSVGLTTPTTETSDIDFVLEPDTTDYSNIRYGPGAGFTQVPRN